MVHQYSQDTATLVVENLLDLAKEGKTKASAQTTAILTMLPCPLTPATTLQNNNIIDSNHAAALRDAYHDPIFEEHIITKFGWTHHTFTSVNCPAMA